MDERKAHGVIAAGFHPHILADRDRLVLSSSRIIRTITIPMSSRYSTTRTTTLAPDDRNAAKR